MFGKRGSPFAASRLVGLLVGVALVLGVPQAASAAEQPQGAALLARGAGYAVADGSARVAALQRRLQGLGESPGPVDGLFGPLTEGAVSRLQQRSGLAADGIVGPATRKALRRAQPRPIARGAGYGVPGGSTQVKSLQRRLGAAGQKVGPIDGIYGPRTELAVRRLQANSRVAVDGVAGPQTYAALDRSRGGDSRQVQNGETKAERRGSAKDERRASAERSKESPTQEQVKPGAERLAATGRPSGEEGGGGTDVPWALIAGLLAVLGAAVALFLARGRQPGRRALAAVRGRLPRRRPSKSVIPLGRGLALEGESQDPDIGSFSGTAYAVEIPESGDPGERAEGSRFFVLDPGRRLPFWVGYSEVTTPLPPALQAHPGPWVGQRGLVPGTPVLGYVTVPKAVPERQAELYDQLARIEGLCKRRKFELLGVVRDVEPNGEDVLERPGIQYALEQFAAHEATALVVCDVSRLGGSREQLDSLLARLTETGVALVALEPELDTSTDEGREVVRHLEIVRTERAKLGSEDPRPSRPGKRRAAARRSGTAEQDAPELRERILAMRDEGESLQTIADALNEERVPTPRGAKWRPASVRAALARGAPGSSRKVVQLKPPRRFERPDPEDPEGAEHEADGSEGRPHAEKRRQEG